MYSSSLVRYRVDTYQKKNILSDLEWNYRKEPWLFSELSIDNETRPNNIPSSYRKNLLLR